MKIIPAFIATVVFSVLPLAAQSIVGSWFIHRGPASQSDAVLSFLPNGTYVMAEDGDRDIDPSGMDGMERGTYKWDAATKAFSSKTLVDTTGEWGLSHANIKSISVTAEQITLGGAGGVVLAKITSPTKKLVGSWYLKEGGGYAVATFLADGSYFMVQDGMPTGGGKTGIERGTYQWNTSTKAFTRKVLLDTNGTWGFSDNSKATILISGNRLTLKPVGGGNFTLSRVIAP